MFLWHRNIFAPVLLLLAASSLHAQRRSPDRDCAYDDRGILTCVINARVPHGLGPVRVPNNANVRIRVENKGPFDDCTVGERKLEELKESSPISNILSALAKVVGFLAKPPEPPVDASGTPIPVGQLIVKRIQLIDSEILSKNEEILTAVDGAYKQTPEKIKSFLHKVFRGDAATFRSEKQDFLDSELRGVYPPPTPTADSIEIERQLLLANLKELQEKHYQELGLDDNPARVEKIHQLVDSLSGNLEALKKNISTLQARREEFEKTRKYLEDIETPEFNKDLPSLVPVQQKRASGSVTCVNHITKEVTKVDAVPYTVIYEGSPWASVSVGVLVSTLEKRKLGVMPIRTGTTSSGTPTFETVFAALDHARAQLVPFSFFNIRVANWQWGSRRIVLSGAGGVGVNPNSGSNQAEFFLGPGIGIQNVYVHFGDHIGRLQEFTGGFNLGDIVPPMFPSTLPIRRVYKNRFGFAVSYRLPLP